MTTEEKAKAYDEALERVKEWITEREQVICPREIVESIFPELRESEDERIRRAIYDFFHLAGTAYELCGIPKANLLAWLEKQKEQKHAEWSEEDEDIRDTIIRDLKHLGGDIVNVNPAYKEEIDWLKSLRPQPHWKPSDEQMEALKCAVEDVAKFSKRGGRQVELENEPYYSALHSLYEDLKKL